MSQLLPNPPRLPHVTPAETRPFEPVCAVFRRYLHSRRLKFTPERAMMLDAVLRHTGLFEPEQLAEDLKKLGHEVSRATVYRTLNHLHDAGLLRQVFFDNRRSYYEVLVGREQSDYLIDVETGKVVEFASQRLKQLRDEIAAEHGFEVISHQFHIFATKRK
jgi:Fur family ferric uptake transcriptional regulator